MALLGGKELAHPTLPTGVGCGGVGFGGVPVKRDVTKESCGGAVYQNQ